MAVTQNELITALHTLLSTNPVRLAMRSGLASELDLADLLVGEIAVATDTLQVWVCTALGTCIQITGGLTALGYYATSGDLSTAHPTGTAGDIYIVGSAPSHLYTWGESAWVDLGAYNDTSTFAANGSVLHITGDETIVGYKSVPTPTASAHVANKAYVDSDWTPILETWAYASATTITVPTGAISRYQKFDKIRYTQSGAVKYGRVLSVSSTLLTLIPSATYAVANSAISNISISRKATPFGFPGIRAWMHSFALASNVVAHGGSYYVINDNNTIDMNMFFSATGNLIVHGQSLFTLPENYRPSEQIVVPGFYQLYQQSGRSPCDIQINTNGVVYVFFNSGETSGNNIFGNATIIL